FKESASSRDNPKRDWYVWRDPKHDGSEPNNWVGVFTGPAWSLDEATGQFYRHSFLPHQPDLNWRNPEVREAMYSVARFWLDLGVDGFRVDAAHQIMKDPLERDNPPVPEGHERPWKDMGEFDDFLHLYDFAHADTHQVHREFAAVLAEYPGEKLSVGEIHIFDMPEWAEFYGEQLDEFSMPFNFHLFAAHWDATSTRAAIESVLWHIPDGTFTNWTLGNHDETRMATRLGQENARMAAVMILTLPGSAYIYYGDELGMEENSVGPDGSLDPWGQNMGDRSRDGSRAPMMWDRSDDAGFGSREPWLPLSVGHKTMNVEAQLDEDGSMLNLYRSILRYRSSSSALRSGDYQTHPLSDDEVLLYQRATDEESLLVALNFSDGIKSLGLAAGRVVVSTHAIEHRSFGSEGLVLEPREAVVIEPLETGRLLAD
ncbi:MAG: alpha-amylase family glycosyl hydrolase, partial [Acidimicrobiia bacterium]